MSKTITLTKEEILHIATLANILLTDEEVKEYGRQLSQTIQYVENLGELDTSSIKPTAHSTDLTNITFEDGENNSRKLSQEEALANTKNQTKGMFIVPRIME